MHPCQFLRRKAASEYLAATWGIPCSPSTLAKLAVIGGGPTFRRAGRIPLYSSGDLDTWATSKLSAPMRSTSDAVSPKASAAGCGPVDRSSKQHGGGGVETRTRVGA